MCEKNLKRLLGLDFVCSEHILKGLRIDTVAFDNATNSFVIIEYKRDENTSMVDQGFAYLSLALRNKASLILQHNKNCSSKIRKTDINWDCTRVIFISQLFTEYQKNLACFTDLPIELYTIRQLESEIFTLEKVMPAEELKMTRPPKKRKYRKIKQKILLDEDIKKVETGNSDNGLLGCIQ